MFIPWADDLSVPSQAETADSYLTGNQLIYANNDRESPTLPGRAPPTAFSPL